MFGLHPCTAHPCNMNGINHQEEADRAPLHLCPECLAKLCWLTGSEPATWLREVADYCEEQGLGEEAARLRRGGAGRRPPAQRRARPGFAGGAGRVTVTGTGPASEAARSSRRCPGASHRAISRPPGW